ncbi:MAG TPA: hypothetical protein VGX48_13485 [Pyrinomonadaceae bacterium]|jgi:hypothetical protein|nr:hypothetical protein [Pyrinomonadaceae bacterium]
MARLTAIALLVVLCACGAARGQESAPTTGGGDERLALILKRAGESVERYHGGMFSVRFTETLWQEELKEDLKTPKKSRQFVYDSRIMREELSEVEGDYVAVTTRRLVSLDGKPSKKTAESKVTSVYSLDIMLPRYQKLYDISLEGEETLAGRRAFRLALLRPGEGEPRVEWEGTRFRVVAPTVTRVWVDAENYDVMQIESDLVAPFEFESRGVFRAGPLGSFGPTRRLRYAREYSLVRFRRVRFKDPEQTLLLPESAEWLKVIEGASHPRTRQRIAFSDYRRFVSGVKIVEDPEPNE